MEDEATGCAELFGVVWYAQHDTAGLLVDQREARVERYRAAGCDFEITTVEAVELPDLAARGGEEVSRQHADTVDDGPVALEVVTEYAEVVEQRLEHPASWHAQFGSERCGLLCAEDP